MSTTGVHCFKELLRWQRAEGLFAEDYRIASRCPRDQRKDTSLRSLQSTIYITANNAQDYGRGTNRPLPRFLDVSRGCAFALETQDIMAHSFEHLTAVAAKICQIPCDLETRTDSSP